MMPSGCRAHACPITRLSGAASTQSIKASGAVIDRTDPGLLPSASVELLHARSSRQIVLKDLSQGMMKATVQNSLQLPSGYHELLQNLKGRIRTAQVRALLLP
jgi:hypothetical protein